MAYRYSDLEDAIVDAVRRGTEGKRVGVACSGGLDSGLVSALSMRYADSVHLYTCGTTGAFDVAMAEDLSRRLGLPWTHVRISKSNIEDLVRGIIGATGITDPFTVSYELQLYSVCREAEEDVIVSGQGSDEYFMGCAKFVGQTQKAYEALRDASVQRLLEVSVPCELSIAEHFGKTLVYPYMDPEVVSRISNLDPEELRPRDMDSRKAVLRDIAEHLGYPELARRKKKSSQYGSGTTDLVRAMARARGMRYNEYIASFCDELSSDIPSCGRGSVINARVDSVLKAEAERIISECGSDPSDAIARFYRRIVRDGDLRSVDGSRERSSRSLLPAVGDALRRHRDGAAVSVHVLPYGAGPDTDPAGPMVLLLQMNVVSGACSHVHAIREISRMLIKRRLDCRCLRKYRGDKLEPCPYAKQSQNT